MNEYHVQGFIHIEGTHEEAAYDFMMESEPIGVEIINVGKEHVEKFKQWMIWMEESGYEIKYEVL